MHGRSRDGFSRHRNLRSASKPAAPSFRDFQSGPEKERLENVNRGKRREGKSRKHKTPRVVPSPQHSPPPTLSRHRRETTIVKTHQPIKRNRARRGKERLRQRYVAATERLGNHAQIIKSEIEKE